MPLYLTLVALLLFLYAPLFAGQSAPAAPVETKTGGFKLSFKERHPLSAKAEMEKRMPYFKATDYDVAAESFEVFVPPAYKPDTPYGLMVFINSGDNGDNNGNFKPLLEKNNIIWIGANKGGNERTPLHRVGLALDSVHNIRKMYNIDPERIYLSGISGGGRAGSGLAPAYPEVFNGVIYLIGCNPNQAKAPPQYADRQKRLNSYVFMTGTKDFNKPGTNDVLKQYKSMKYERTLYLKVPDMGHDMPPTDWLAKAIAYLDEPLSAAAKAAMAQAQDQEKREKYGQALVLYRKAAARGGESGKEAQGKVAALTAKRDDVLASAKTLIEEKKGSEAVPILEKLLRAYETEAGDVRELLRQARK